MKEDRIKNLEVEVAYLRKSIEKLIEIVNEIELNNYHYTNIYYSKDYLDSLTDEEAGE